MARIALYLQDSHDLRDGLDYARYAEQRGFEAVWQAESRLVRDAIVPMAAYAAAAGRAGRAGFDGVELQVAEAADHHHGGGPGIVAWGGIAG